MKYFYAKQGEAGAGQVTKKTYETRKINRYEKTINPVVTMNDILQALK